MLFLQPELLFPSLLPCPTLIHPEEAKHPCSFLCAAFPERAPLPTAPRPQAPQAGDCCVWLWRLLSGPPALLAQDRHLAPPAVNPTENSVVPVPLAACPVVHCTGPY